MEGGKKKIDWIKVIGEWKNYISCKYLDARHAKELRGLITQLLVYLKEHRIIKCFVAGTLVQTDEGEKPIEDVEVGDRVWAYDTAIGSWRYAAVTAVHKSWFEGTFVTVITTEGEVTSTDGHPYWAVSGDGVEARPTPEWLIRNYGVRESAGGKWVAAAHLRVGDLIRTSTGTTGRVAGLRSRRDSCWVYNLTVEGLHTYTVGPSGLVAHNGTPEEEACKAAAEAAVDIAKHHDELAGINLKGFSKGQLAKHFEKHVEKGKEATEGALMEKVGNTIVKVASDGRVLIVNAKSRNIKTYYKASGTPEDAFKRAVEKAKEFADSD